jgi:hypothetical protein
LNYFNFVNVDWILIGIRRYPQNHRWGLHATNHVRCQQRLRSWRSRFRLPFLPTRNVSPFKQWIYRNLSYLIYLNWISYAASYLLEKSTFTPLDAYTQAGRQGRTGESCAQIYSQCNEL